MLTALDVAARATDLCKQVPARALPTGTSRQSSPEKAELALLLSCIRRVVKTYACAVFAMQRSSQAVFNGPHPPHTRTHGLFKIHHSSTGPGVKAVTFLVLDGEMHVRTSRSLRQTPVPRVLHRAAALIITSSNAVHDREVLRFTHISYDLSICSSVLHLSISAGRCRCGLRLLGSPGTQLQRSH